MLYIVQTAWPKFILWIVEWSIFTYMYEWLLSRDSYLKALYHRSITILYNYRVVWVWVWRIFIAFFPFFSPCRLLFSEFRLIGDNVNTFFTCCFLSFHSFYSLFPIKIFDVIQCKSTMFVRFYPFFAATWNDSCLLMVNSRTNKLNRNVMLFKAAFKQEKKSFSFI